MTVVAQGKYLAQRLLAGRRRKAAFRAALGLTTVGVLILVPVDIQISSGRGQPEIGVADAMAQSLGSGGGAERSVGRSGGPERERSRPERERSRPDRDRADRDDRGGPEDRGASSRGGSGGGGDRDWSGRGGRGTPEVDRSVTTPDSPAAAAIGRALGERDGAPATAPTEAGAARVRAMVEIARDLGAATSPRSEAPRISGAVTQEMLDQAEERYVAAVQEAWEAHGFPWNDSEVLQSLEELDALVSALESIMRDVDGGAPGATVATDINNDGFVDINDLWDAHLR